MKETKLIGMKRQDLNEALKYTNKPLGYKRVQNRHLEDTNKH